MRIYARLILATALLAPACAPSRYKSITVRQVERTGAVPGAGVCSRDRQCELIGMIMIVPRAANRSQATLTQGGTACLPLLLPDRVFARSRRYDGKRVRVRGTALARGPDSPPDIDMIQYRDRWLSPHICGESALAFYVDDLTLSRSR